MSTTSTKTKDKNIPCSEVHFAEIDFPQAAQPRLVIEFADGLKIIVASRRDIQLAADLIDEVRRLRQKGGRS